MRQDSARFDGTALVGAPLGPRARVEARAADAGDFHGPSVVARGHARAAGGNDFGDVFTADKGFEARTERGKSMAITSPWARGASLLRASL